MSTHIVLDALAHLAWADDILFEEERDLLISVMDRDKIPAAERDRWLTQSPELPTAAQLCRALPTEASRRDFLGQVLRLAKADDNLAPEEWRVLQKFCEVLAVPASDWAQLQSWLEASDA